MKKLFLSLIVLMELAGARRWSHRVQPLSGFLR